MLHYTVLPVTAAAGVLFTAGTGLTAKVSVAIMCWPADLSAAQVSTMPS